MIAKKKSFANKIFLRYLSCMAIKALTVRIDERVIRRAKEYAKISGIKMYALVESAIRNAVPEKKGKAA